MGTLGDGLGVRRFDSFDGRIVEVLDLAPHLAQSASFEAAIRARATRLSNLDIESVASVRRIDRDGPSLRVIADNIKGLRLPDFLRSAGKLERPLTVPAKLELASQIISAVAALHRHPGLAHGAITPAHVVVTSDAGVMLTDSVFGDGLESLEWSRDRLWRELGLAMPTSASLPRFDARGDVTQLGATVLSVIMGRLLQADEYPRPIFDLVNAATASDAPDGPLSTASRLRMWLHQALYLHPRQNFASAVEAERAFSSVIGPPSSRRAGVVALESVRHLLGGSSASAPKPPISWSTPLVVPPLPPVTAPPSFLGSVFSSLRTS